MHQPGLYRDALRCKVVGAMSEISWASASTRTRSTDRFDRRRDRTLAEAIRIRRAQLLRSGSIARRAAWLGACAARKTSGERPTACDRPSRLDTLTWTAAHKPLLVPTLPF